MTTEAPMNRISIRDGHAMQNLEATATQRRTSRAAWAAVLLALLIGPGAVLADSELERESLKGLLGVNVLIEDLDDEDKRAGFDKGTFQTDVEVKLRIAGIKVLTNEQRLGTPGMPSLYLNVNLLHDRPGAIAAYSIDLQVTQGVRLDRNMEFHTAATWSSGSTGYGDLHQIRAVVKDLVDKFINAWLSVNPK